MTIYTEFIENKNLKCYSYIRPIRGGEIYVENKKNNG
jgi:hypothetical protein